MDKIEKLRSILFSSATAEEKKKAIKKLKENGGMNAIKCLKELLRSEKNPIVIGYTSKALVSLGQEDYVFNEAVKRKELRHLIEATIFHIVCSREKNVAINFLCKVFPDLKKRNLLFSPHGQTWGIIIQHLGFIYCPICGHELEPAFDAQKEFPYILCPYCNTRFSPFTLRELERQEELKERQNKGGRKTTKQRLDNWKRNLLTNRLIPIDTTLRELESQDPKIFDDDLIKLITECTANALFRLYSYWIKGRKIDEIALSEKGGFTDVDDDLMLAELGLKVLSKVSSTIQGEKNSAKLNEIIVSTYVDMVCTGGKVKDGIPKIEETIRNILFRLSQCPNSIIANVSQNVLVKIEKG